MNKTIERELAGTPNLGVPLNNGEIAALIDLQRETPSYDRSYQTLKNRRHHAYEKLGVHSPIGAYKALGWIREEVLV